MVYHQSHVTTKAFPILKYARTSGFAPIRFLRAQPCAAGKRHPTVQGCTLTTDELQLAEVLLSRLTRTKSSPLTVQHKY